MSALLNGSEHNINTMISIIIATKNGEAYIERAIKSVQHQSEKDLEIIVVSDGSTDLTSQIVNRLAKADPRIQLIEQNPNIGPGRARDLAIQHAKNDLVAIIDDDDVWLSDQKLAHQKTFLDNNADHVLVGAGEVDFVRENGEHIFTFTPPLKDCHIRDTILLRNAFISSSVMFRKSAYQKVGGFSSLYLAEDYDLWMKLGTVGKFANIEDARVQYTVRNGGLSRSRRQEMNRTVLALIKRHRKEYPNFVSGYIKAHARIVFAWLKSIVRREK